MTSAFYLTGEVRRVLTAMAEAGIAVDLVVGSPPFLRQRSYLPAGHRHKRLEIGQEATPGDYIDTLIEVTELAEAVLAPHGSLCIELGDTAAGSGGAGGDYRHGGLRAGQPRYDGTAAKARRRNGDFPNRDDYPRPNRARQRDTPTGWPADKSLCMVPELYRTALAYGFNPLTGRSTPRWRVRNRVIWARTNPPPGRDGDKFRRATSDVMVACRTDKAGRRRYWDGDAVRTVHARDYAGERHGSDREFDRRPDKRRKGTSRTVAANPAGAPLLDWWTTGAADDEDDLLDLLDELWVVTGAGYRGAHYATFPPALVEPLIKAMCPPRVCLACGEPSRRIVDVAPSAATGKPGVAGRRRGEQAGLGATGERHTEARTATPVGWSCCGCGPRCRPTTWEAATIGIEQGQTPNGDWRNLEGWDLPVAPAATRVRQRRRRVLADAGDCSGGHWRAGRVLDPFAGSGTSLAVAAGHGRVGIGIDLDDRNVELARERIGPLLFGHITLDELAAALQAPPDAALVGASS